MEEVIWSGLVGGGEEGGVACAASHAPLNSFAR